MGEVRWPTRARGWIGQPVRLGAVQLGVVADVLANETLGHVLGFEIRGGDSCARFLPWVAAEVRGDHVEVRSVYSLLSPAELAVYVDGGTRLGEQADDVLVDGHGDVEAIVARGPEIAPSDDDVARRSAA